MLFVQVLRVQLGSVVTGFIMVVHDGSSHYRTITARTIIPYRRERYPSLKKRKLGNGNVYVKVKMRNTCKVSKKEGRRYILFLPM